MRGKYILPRPCAVCGTPLTPRPNEYPSQFNVRRTCNLRCAGLKGHQRQDTGTKVCDACGVTFERGPQERIVDFKRRRTCGYACGRPLGGKARRIEPEPKPCVGCGKLFSRGAIELIAHFHQRQSCGRAKCQSIAKSVGRLKRIRTQPYPIGWDSRISRAIRRRDNYACQLCGLIGGKRAHPVHHIDYQKTNCDPRNLITLCRSCHGITNGDRPYWQTTLTELMTDRMKR
jgi:5-methylcytosine-specific restriction endonuclease McrA